MPPRRWSPRGSRTLAGPSLARNVHVGRHELDLVAIDPGPPAECWSSSRCAGGRVAAFGLPEETVDHRKRARVRAAAYGLLDRGRLPDGSTLPQLAAAVRPGRRRAGRSDPPPPARDVRSRRVADRWNGDRVVRESALAGWLHGSEGPVTASQPERTGCRRTVAIGEHADRASTAAVRPAADRDRPGTLRSSGMRRTLVCRTSRLDQARIEAACHVRDPVASCGPERRLRRPDGAR